MADGKMLQVILFALLFGLALSKAGTAAKSCAFFRGLEWGDDAADYDDHRANAYWCVLSNDPAWSDGLAEIAKAAMYFATIVIALLAHAALVYPLLLKSLTA